MIYFKVLSRNYLEELMKTVSL